jgi:pimeloyl-ACP methyl ester carboxylesterase
VTCPIDIVHGTADDIIPFTSGQKLSNAIKVPHGFHPLIGLSHNDLADAPEFQAALTEILE